MIKVLYVGLKYDYGVVDQGPSYEQVNFWYTLERMPGVEARAFHFDEVMQQVGRAAMNRFLLRTVEEFQPEVCLFVLFTDEIEKETIAWISRATRTVNWFGDDHWRFESFSQFWAPLFHWVITTDAEAVEKYRAIGCDRVLLSQWAYNHFLYEPVEVRQDISVSFVGRAHSNRKRQLERLRRSGVQVQCWGRGWQYGRISQQEMIQLYARSKINLNFTESSARFGWRPLAKVVVKRRADGTIRLNSWQEIVAAARALWSKPRRQIKGRNFEIPGSGGFLLTEAVDYLQDYYIPGKEIAVFSSVDELIEKVNYYLSHDEEREEVRQAGFQRTLRDHTYEKRFSKIFETMGLKKSV
jgi:spore maturation protein CgeB